MRRLGFGLMVSVAALGCASQALAADLDYPEMRGSYNSWDQSMEPEMEFRAGLRYMYSVGATSVTAAGNSNPKLNLPASSATTNDTTHFAEAYLRLDDLVTDTYLSAHGGYSMLLDASYSNSLAANGQTSIGNIAYAVADFGYMPIKLGADDAGVTFGGFAGYQYINDAPTVGGGEFNPIQSDSDLGWTSGDADYFSPVDHADHNLNVNALRIGVAAKAKAGDFDFSAEVAAIPYASITGVMGSHTFNRVDNGSYWTHKATESKFEGSAWGGAVDAMMGYNITENFAVRVGGRATYLQGQGNLVYGLADVTKPYDSTDADPDIDVGPSTGGTYYITPERLEALSLWRYGILAEIAVKF